MSFSQLDYCQYLLSSPNNYTLNNLAKHLENVSHDTINRYLTKENFTSESLWQNVKKDIQISENSAIIFDDTVLDKRFGEKIELVRRQYSGTEHRVLSGIGLVNCVYVNPELGLFWVIDYRIYDPEYDNKTKLDHDLTQASTLDTKKTCAIRWKIEEFHREIKQLTGIESCQCRKASIQRNHIACALLVWNQLKRLAHLTKKTVYQLKAESLSSYLIKELNCPSIKMELV